MVTSYPIENQAFDSIERCTSIRREFKPLILSQSETIEKARGRAMAEEKNVFTLAEVILHPLFLNVYICIFFAKFVLILFAYLILKKYLFKF